jgi:Domain of unknown function (DUF4148)
VQTVHVQALVCFYFSNAQLKHRWFIDASAMPTVRSIDEEGLTEAGQDGTPCRRARNKSHHFDLEEMTMNAKLLFAATIAVSALATFASSTVLADEIHTPLNPLNPLTRAEVNAQFEQARASGTLQKTDYDFTAAGSSQGAALSRADVLATLAAKPSALLANSSARSRSYNPFGTELLQASVVTRAAVKAETLQAAANGTLPRTDYDYDQHLVARRAVDKTAKPILARLLRSNQAGS